MALRSLSSFTAVRFEAPKSNGAPIPPPRHQDPLPRLSVTKPSWVVRTESNVHREVRRKPDPPCEVCTGSGRVNCHDCYGTGVAAKVEQLMRNFLWEGAEEGKNVHLVNWERVSRIREAGELGIGSLRERNEALRAKWLWRFPIVTNATWDKVIKSKYGLDSDVLLIFCWQWRKG
ncbi:PREDICTED: uncharacterized protein LOC103331404 isoform X1 [Prunus mume]|uniref:Uncharacterized protein LOC103331404 isoform X1 n=1 Tax=Prunus mume TaxID=102107 RepID=A0ABM0NZM9_PRUMU|nr:PREDICTED: uncharacterized protein LOC103331404 isoform X1 [Prunus mume]